MWKGSRRPHPLPPLQMERGIEEKEVKIKISHCSLTPGIKQLKIIIIIDH
jgi:hypothetical protein